MRPEEEVLSAAEKRWQAWRALSLLLFYCFILACFCYVFWDAFLFQKFKAAEHPRMKSTAFDAKPCVTPRGSGCVLDPESKLCWFVDDVRYSLVSVRLRPPSSRSIMQSHCDWGGPSITEDFAAFLFSCFWLNSLYSMVEILGVFRGFIAISLRIPWTAESRRIRRLTLQTRHKER